jgi:hypothetical protein
MRVIADMGRSFGELVESTLEQREFTLGSLAAAWFARSQAARPRRRADAITPGQPLAFGLASRGSPRRRA